MRRRTPAAKKFGEILYKLRIEKHLTMRQLAGKTGVVAATISQIEKAERALKEPKIGIWAKALGVDESHLREEWILCQSEPDPPIVRKRRKSTTTSDLTRLIMSLSSSERNRVLGYIDSLIEKRTD